MKDHLIKGLLNEKVNMTPNPHGFIADQLTPEQFEECYHLFFEQLIYISESDLSGIKGYGELGEDGQTEFNTCREYMIGTFADDQEGYWLNWKELFDTSVLDKAFFEMYYEEMVARIPYCEGQRYLTYNNAFFDNMITDGISSVGFPDWSRVAVSDCLVDFAIMDLNKPYLKIPEKLFAYCNEQGIEIDNFKERYLCIAYYKGIDTLRWHASIDDQQSCTSIMKSISELKDRIYAL